MNYTRAYKGFIGIIMGWLGDYMVAYHELYTNITGHHTPQLEAFIYLPVSSSGSCSGFQIPDFLVFHTPHTNTKSTFSFHSMQYAETPMIYFFHSMLFGM